MDADAFGAFEEAGNIFDPATAKRLLDDIYSSGGSVDPEDAYVAFRGREPETRRAAAPTRFARKRRKRRERAELSQPVVPANAGTYTPRRSS